MFRPRRPPRIRGLSLNRMIPNILTMAALCAGMTAIRYGLDGRWRAAVFAVLLAAILDGLDGRIARLLHGSSKFGAELDSLSDFISFGVAPAVMLYFWTMNTAGDIGWPLVLLYAVCCALRLARFNTMLGGPELPPFAYNFFTGVPAPAAAGLVLLPLVGSFQFPEARFFSHPAVNGAMLIVVSLLMVSRIPTFSGKGLRVPHEYVAPILLLTGVLAAFVVAMPWATILMIGLAYLGAIPLSIRSFRRLERHAAAMQQGGEDAAGAG